MQKVNYIIHLNTAFEVMCNDERLTPFHVSMYFSLFQYWNMAKFRNPISISRHELMRSSKIGSVNTYIRTIRDLSNWNFIKYVPSYNPQKGSQVYLYNFDNSKSNGNNNSNDNGIDNSPDQAADKASGKAKEKPLRPSKNSSNNTNKLNNKNGYGHTSKKINSNSDLVVTKLFVNEPGESKRKKVAPKKEKQNPLSKGRGAGGEGHPTLKQIQTHFNSKQWPAIEAKKFFNHYQGNGWLVGGKTPMQSWKAIASNWIINSEKFAKSPFQKKSDRTVKPGKLNVSNDKNYSEPL